ncbi:hypothetical protein AB3662_18210 [Sorangium cellulosum]|uniref:hypothetical protein n=1 Tax=Sorangium cellulosum TaxID=56 RepID=UPI003D9AA656
MSCAWDWLYLDPRRGSNDGEDGHYHHHVDGVRRIVVVSHDHTPSNLDRALLTGLAQHRTG